jgi:hypothetical protein
MYDRKASELRSQSLTLSRRIEEIRAAAPAAVEDAINLMDLTSRAADLFAVQPVHEKQGFLRLILKSATWRQGELQTEFQQPFENLRRSNQLSSTKHKENGATNAEIDIWIPSQDSTCNPSVTEGYPCVCQLGKLRHGNRLPGLSAKVRGARGHGPRRAALNH